MEPNESARPRSPTMRIGRLRRRSTHAPAGRPNRMNGRNSTVASRPTSNALAFNSRMAISGRPSSVTCVPSWLMVSAVHSFMKSRCRNRLRAPGRNLRFAGASLGDASVLPTAAPSYPGPAPESSARGRRYSLARALRSPLQRPRDGHERCIHALGALGRSFAFLERFEHLQDLLLDADELRWGHSGIGLLKGGSLPPRRVEALFPSQVITDDSLVVFDPSPHERAHCCQHFGAILGLFGDAVARDQRGPTPLPSILGGDF